MKTVGLIFSVLVTLVSYGQSLLCKPHGSSLYERLEIVKPDGSLGAPWFIAKLDNKYSQRKIFIVEQASRGPNLLFVSRGKSPDFIADLGTYKGPGLYHSVKIDLGKGTKFEETARLMCDQTGDVDFTNICALENLSPGFFEAIKSRKRIDVESYLACGLEVNIKDNHGCTPLLTLGDSSCGTKSDLLFQPMTSAIEIAEILVDNGALLESKDPVTGERVIHKFSKIQDFEVVNLLLDLEADVDSQDNLGHTALMIAVENNDFHLTKRIVESGASLKLKNRNGDTALSIAEKRGLTKLIPLLRAAQSKVLIIGQNNNLCSPASIQLKLNEVVQFTLQASENEMFLLTSPRLGLNLMAEAGSRVNQTLILNQKGIFDFECGVHGGPKQTLGQIRVE